MLKVTQETSGRAGHPSPVLQPLGRMTKYHAVCVEPAIRPEGRNHIEEKSKKPLRMNKVRKLTSPLGCMGELTLCLYPVRKTLLSLKSSCPHFLIIIFSFYIRFQQNIPLNKGQTLFKGSGSVGGFLFMKGLWS